MRTLSAALLSEQKKATALPALSLVFKQYGHPAKAAVVQPGLFGWTRLYLGEEAYGYHASAIAGDGSLVRVRLVGTLLQSQRVTNPSASSDYSAWVTFIDTSLENQPPYSCAASPVAVAANGADVIIAATCLNDQAAYSVFLFKSTDYGATFTEIREMLCAGTSALALCSDPVSGLYGLAVSEANTVLLKVFVLHSDGTTHMEGTKTGMDVDGIAMCFDGDWNMVAMINDGNFLRMYRLVYGAGYRSAEDVFSGWELLNTGKADSNEWALIQQYYDRPQAVRFPIPFRPYTELRRWGRARQYIPRQGYSGLFGGYIGGEFMNQTSEQRKVFPTIRTPEQNTAIKHYAVVIARGADNLNLDAPYLCKPPGCSPILAVYKNLERWFFRIKPGTDFYDFQWTQAAKLTGSCMYGLALCCNDTYIYATRNNEIWRSPIPGLVWDVPTIGSGAAETGQTIDIKDIRHIEESITPQDVSTLEVILDNSLGGYASLPGTHIKKGSQVELGYGYLVPTSDTPGGNKYFIEDWSYDRAPGESTVTINCIDAWGLLEKYVVPAPAEFNFMANTLTVYALIERVLLCVGCSLTYVSRSTDITTVYPKLEVAAGETGASLLRNLLAMVPDTLYFNGLVATIINPQATDPSTYQFTFPEGNQ